MRICDPTPGSGGMLIECAHFIERRGGNPRNLTLHGYWLSLKYDRKKQQKRAPPGEENVKL